MSTEILRYIDSIARDKEIDKEELISSIEVAVAQAISKKYGIDDLEFSLDRVSGKWQSNYEISLEEQGRILAMTVKQTIIGKVREYERDNIYAEYEQRIGDILSGTVQRFEGDTVIVNIGRNMEAILPRAEKVRTEAYNVGDRIRALIYEVKTAGPRVKIILSRGHKDFVRALFELEVPEVADGVIQIRRIEREPGYRTKVAVHSTDTNVDCVGACVGVRGTRIKSVIDELNGERIDIIRWSDDPETLIVHALNRDGISHIELDPQTRKALVLVDEDQLSITIGRKGQNVRLASKITGWDIDIMTREELKKTIAEEDAAEATPEGEDAEGAASTETASTTEESADASTESSEDAEGTESSTTESSQNAPAAEQSNTESSNPTAGA